MTYSQVIQPHEFLASELQWLNAHYVDNPSEFHTKALKTLAAAYQTGDKRSIGEAHFILM